MGREQVLEICCAVGNGNPLEGEGAAWTPYELSEGLGWVAARNSAIELELVRCIG